MTKHVLFIQGAGEGANEADKKLASSLGHSLGSGYEVHYPAMPEEGDTTYTQWKPRIEAELIPLPEPVILVGHSVGASMILKYLSELEVERSIAGIFLIACPFWGGNGWRYAGYETLALPEGFAAKLPEVSIVFYHCRDDKTVPFEHLALYAHLLPQAKIREIESGGHQLSNDLSMVATDIKNLSQDAGHA